MSKSCEFKDGLTAGPVRGRGAGINPGNRFDSGPSGGRGDLRLHVLGEHLDEVIAENPDGTQVITRVYSDSSKTVINPVNIPDLSMKWTVNPYRGCEHGCIYCYARPGHEYLSLSCGLDFETKIVAKFDAPELLRAALARPKWEGESIVFSGVTDPYQPIESKLRITRRCLEICAEMAQPVCMITKSRLVQRDIDLLGELARHNAAGVAVSVTSLDPDLAMKMEPRAASPRHRLETIRRLTDAGIPVTVMAAPIIPSLNEHEIPAILKAAADAGARSAGWVLLRLPYQIKDLFLDWLAREFPDRAAKVEHALRETRGGELYDATPFARRRGRGVRAENIRDTFNMFKARCGLDKGGGGGGLSSAEFLRRRESKRDSQATLFTAVQPRPKTPPTPTLFG